MMVKKSGSGRFIVSISIIIGNLKNLKLIWIFASSKKPFKESKSNLRFLGVKKNSLFFNLLAILEKLTLLDC